MELDKLIEYTESKLRMSWELEPNMTAFYTNMHYFLQRYQDYLEDEFK